MTGSMVRNLQFSVSEKALQRILWSVFYVQHSLLT